MSSLTVFYLDGCPYCRMGRRAAEELEKENAAYAAVAIDWIEENAHPEISDRYDYYRVPAIFCGEEKLYEASPAHSYDDIRENIRLAFDTMIRKES